MIDLRGLMSALLLASLAIALAALPAAEGAKLSLMASMSKPSYGAGEAIAISGMLKDEGGNPVRDAAISIQINFESGRPVGLALLYTDGEGRFNYEFKMPAGSEAGPYRAFLTASKPGFEDASAQLGFTFIPEAPMGSLPILALVLMVSALSLLGLNRRRAIGLRYTN
ncbi:MAG: carboxypeptidase-like regulatory domain-containing protein [Candidatus Bathyarchaeia archaeon]